MTNTYRQLPSQFDWEYTHGDAVSAAFTIATDPEEVIDLDAEPVTAFVAYPSRDAPTAFDVEVVDDDVVRLTPPDGLPVGRHGWWMKWRDRTLLSRHLEVHDPSSAAASNVPDTAIVVEFTDLTVAITVENGGIPGSQGETGTSVPDGGTIGQALTKNSGVDGDVEWTTIPLTVNGQTGTVSLDYGDIGAEPDGAVDAAMAAHVAALDPHTQYLTETAATAGYAPIAAGIPTGGTSGQILTKDSGTDLDVSWQDAPEGGGGGTWGSITGTLADQTDLDTALDGKADIGQAIPVGGTSGQVLMKDTGTDYDVSWQTPEGGGDGLPTQTGNSGKFLTTNGTVASWEDLPPSTYWHVYSDEADARVGSADVEVWVPDDPGLGDPENAAVGDFVWRSRAVETLMFALSDEDTELTTGNGKLTVRAPFDLVVVDVRASLVTASTTGAVTVDINDSGTTIFSTPLTIDQGETTSTTAATAAVVSDATIADDAVIRFDIDGAGVDATGLKVTLYVVRA